LALAQAGPGTGTTLTAMLWSGSQLALVHVGDTRAYLLRASELFQITHDHSVVQALLDEGKITPEEAESHPQRSLLLRAIDGDGATEPDVSLHDAQPGDRYLLCSDGLTAVVSPVVIRDTLSAPGDPEQAVGRLIDLANEAGGPDNIACVVADVVEQQRALPRHHEATTDQVTSAGRIGWPCASVKRIPTVSRAPGRRACSTSAGPRSPSRSLAPRNSRNVPSAATSPQARARWRSVRSPRTKGPPKSRPSAPRLMVTSTSQRAEAASPGTGSVACHGWPGTIRPGRSLLVLRRARWTFW
jgi:hypothetical protein